MPTIPAAVDAAALAIDQDVRDRDVQLRAQLPELSRLDPVGPLARGRDDDHLVGAEVAQLVLERGVRVRVADFAARLQPLRRGPGE